MWMRACVCGIGLIIPFRYYKEPKYAIVMQRRQFEDIWLDGCCLKYKKGQKITDSMNEPLRLKIRQPHVRAHGIKAIKELQKMNCSLKVILLMKSCSMLLYHIARLKSVGGWSQVWKKTVTLSFMWAGFSSNEKTLLNCQTGKSGV